MAQTQMPQKSSVTTYRCKLCSTDAYVVRCHCWMWLFCNSRLFGRLKMFEDAGCCGLLAPSCWLWPCAGCRALRRLILAAAPAAASLSAFWRCKCLASSSGSAQLTHCTCHHTCSGISSNIHLAVLHIAQVVVPAKRTCVNRRFRSIVHVPRLPPLGGSHHVSFLVLQHNSDMTHLVRLNEIQVDAKVTCRFRACCGTVSPRATGLVHSALKSWHNTWSPAGWVGCELHTTQTLDLCWHAVHN